jgi:hypothetical protein
MILLKVGAFVLICIAVWYTARFMVVAYDKNWGVQR